MGKIEVPANVYWGAQTSVRCFTSTIGPDKMPPELIRAFRILKKSWVGESGFGKLPRISRADRTSRDRSDCSKLNGTSSRCASGKPAVARRPT